MTAIRLAPDLLAKIDAWAAERGVKRSEAIRTMIETALQGGGS